MLTGVDELVFAPLTGMILFGARAPLRGAHGSGSSPATAWLTRMPVRYCGCEEPVAAAYRAEEQG